MKKIVTLFATLCIVFTMLGTFTVFADETESDLKIGTLAELEAFRDDVNSGNTYEGKTIVLTADIDMSEKYGENINGEEVSWMPIGTKEHPFNGSFDGRSHTIGNLYIKFDDGDNISDKGPYYLGLFGYTESGSVIKNLNISGSILIVGTMYFGFKPPAESRYHYTGAVAGYCNGTLNNCHNSTNITVSGNTHYLGGIAGLSYGTINRCSNGGAILCETIGYGGLIGGGGICGGIFSEGAAINNCYNIGDVTALEAGGILGRSGENTGGISNCWNKAQITGSERGGAGEIGEHTAAAIRNCYCLNPDYDAPTPQNDINYKTTEQFASGEVAYLLNEGKSEGDIAWYQNIGTDAFPVLDDTHSIVYMKYYNNEPVSSNQINAYMGRYWFDENDYNSPHLFTSYNELQAYANEHHLVYDEYNRLLELFPPEFFEDKFLYAKFIEGGSGSNRYTVTATEKTNSIDLEVARIQNGMTDDYFEYCLYTEIDKSLLDKKINVAFVDLTSKTYPYEITGLRFTDTNGNEIVTPEQNKSFIVEADIVKTEERNEKDYLFIAVYDEKGVLINIDYVKAKFTVDGECSFGFNIPAQTKKVGSVKAFVWNTFHSMEPLAQTKILAPVVFE